MNTVSRLCLSGSRRLCFDSIAKHSPPTIRRYSDGAIPPFLLPQSTPGAPNDTIPSQNTSAPEEESSENRRDPGPSESRKQTRPKILIPAVRLKSVPRFGSSTLDRITALYQNLDRSRFPVPKTDRHDPSALADVIESQSSFELVHPRRPPEELSPDNFEKLAQLTEFLAEFWRVPIEAIPINDVCEMYLDLPGTRVCYLSRRHTQNLLHLLSDQDVRRNSVFEMYMTILEDMQANGTNILQREWVGLLKGITDSTYFHPSLRTDLALALLEGLKRAGYKYSIETLTTIFTMAGRSRNSTLVNAVDHLLRENKYENLWVWTERLKQAGQLADSAKVHEVLQEFSKTGLTVDIVFVNTLLRSLLMTNDITSAEFGYMQIRNSALERYKNQPLPVRPSLLHATTQRKAYIYRSDHSRWRNSKETELRLRRINLELVKSEPQLAQRVDEMFDSGFRQIWYGAKVVPQLATVRNMISYHCHYTGNMQDIAFYLNDMELFDIPQHLSIYMHIFHGFFLWHKEGSEWNAQRLDKLYSIIEDGIKDGLPVVDIDWGLALTVIRACGKVHGAKKAREAWNLLEPLLISNENAEISQSKKAEIIWNLESVVRAFERHGKLNWALSGGWRIWSIQPWLGVKARYTVTE